MVREEEPNWEQVQIDRDMLANQIERTQAQALNDAELSAGLRKLDNILAEYNRVLGELVQRDRPSPPQSPGDQLQRILERLEREAQALYGRQEQRFSGASAPRWTINAVPKACSW